ncbi:hypothetical protein [Mesorhizobium sp.]|uniref:hypothetical protein n=1 Tax=Mesorhizobium sp. TaxID=1871066 RepID=UPI000FEA4E78|nr:hypothetical protein [Mesorhizobium sp.]RWQ65053.1 MAG: hypothetical protein EOS86_17300 [Mesorhizobium sp.]
MDTFFQASLQVQLAIGAGYLGYLAAYGGIRNHHQQIDVAFLTVAFGLVATASALITSPLMPAAWAIICSTAAAVAAGILWRKWGRNSVRWALKISRVNFADDDPTVLTALGSDTQHNVSQVLVVLTDGSEFMCQDTAQFRDAPIAPFIYGTDGSIAMYVTHSYRRSETGSLVENIRRNTKDAAWGDRMTIVPAASIRNVDLRFQRKR